MVIPASVPGQRIYKDGRLLADIIGPCMLSVCCVGNVAHVPQICDVRFWLQGPGPAFETFDCSMVFQHAEPYQAWVQALASWLVFNAELVVCGLGLQE